MGAETTISGPIIQIRRHPLSKQSGRIGSRRLGNFKMVMFDLLKNRTSRLERCPVKMLLDHLSQAFPLCRPMFRQHSSFPQRQGDPTAHSHLPSNLAPSGMTKHGPQVKAEDPRAMSTAEGSLDSLAQIQMRPRKIPTHLERARQDSPFSDFSTSNSLQTCLLKHLVQRL